MIIVNGKEINLTENTTVAEYLEQNQYQVKRIAVELNGDILPKYGYSDTMLKDGDRLLTWYRNNYILEEYLRLTLQQFFLPDTDSAPDILQQSYPLSD